MAGCEQVFLRELISNAADATEKRRYLLRTGTEGLQHVEQEEIEIFTNSDDNTLTIGDSGVPSRLDRLPACELMIGASDWNDRD